MDPRLEKMANVLVNYSIGVQPGQWVVILGPPPGEPLAQACAEAITRAGGHATALLLSEEIAEAVLALASDEQAQWIPPHLRVIYEQADAHIGILAPRKPRTGMETDPRKLALWSRARESLHAILNQRQTAGDFHWTLTAYPTAAAAQEAGMSLDAYQDFVYAAGLLHEDDPPTAWRRLGARQRALIDWLKDRHSIRITGPDTDLTLSVAGRTWISDEGKENFPGGEIFTGPVEDSAEGIITFSPPDDGAGGARRVGLRFSKGQVVQVSAASPPLPLLQALNMDEGARRLGEVAFGTNYGITRFTGNPLFDEKIGGTVHLALGRSYPETGGRNQSAVHWDQVYDLRSGGEVYVDGQLFSRNGDFCV